MVAFSFLGDAGIDLTYASFGEEGVEITAQAILGVVNIVVPPDARVTMTGFPLVGSLSPTREPGPADGPRVNVRAFVLLGEVTIHRAEAKADDD